ncbi:predicted protein [Histoplasma mississippiense (nom. inval.)]|nr:predicted protein [Histoplasma mississippiense (nom. inval.)]EDN04805.1 predicted protein [Histoplasma mississippiense (nom. inval.)]
MTIQPSATLRSIYFVAFYRDSQYHVCSKQPQIIGLTAVEADLAHLELVS